MKRILIVAAVIAVLLLGGWLLMNRTGQGTDAPITDANSALRAIASEVVTIEQQLSALQPAAETGTLDAASAADARAVLEADLRELVAAITAIDAYALDAAQRTALTQTLETLQAVFTRYQALLVAVDTTTGTTVETATVGTESLTAQFVDTLERFNDQVASTVRDYDVAPTPIQPATTQYLDALDAAIDAAEAAAEPAPATTTDASVSASATLQVEASTPSETEVPVPTDETIPTPAPVY